MDNRLLSSASQVFSHADPYEVSEYVKQHAGPHFIRSMDRGSECEASLEHRKFSSLDLCQISYGGAVQVTTTSLENIYHLQIMLSGHCHWQDPRGDRVFVPGELMLINPDEQVVLTYSNDCRKLIVKLPVGLLESTCRNQHWQLPETGIRFTSSCYELNALGGFISLLKMICIEAEEPITQPLVQDHYAQIITSKLLSLLQHNVQRVVPRLQGASFDGLVAYINEHLMQDISLEKMLEIAGVSERSLYGLFERYVGSSPQNFIRHLKLERIHAQLLDPASRIRSVTEVALDYGFLNPGRFAQSYKQRFGELPSETYKRNRRN